MKWESMRMVVKIISKKFVLPSLPTPPHLKTYKISLLDQFRSSAYIPTIIFYQNSRETSKITERSEFLQQSLSQSLSRFYPLAGKIKDELSIDCNDEGVCYTEAKSNILLSQYLDKPDLNSLNKLIPVVNRDYKLSFGSPVALIQKTSFACGGFTIGMYASHKVFDATSVIAFLKNWAATTATVTATLTPMLKSVEKYPFLGGESIFPQYTSFPKNAYPTSIFAPFLKKGKYVTKRIVFNESAITNLKEKAVRLGNINNPTRVELVTAILCKLLMASFKNKTGIDKPLAITHAVNLRRKIEPPLSEYSVGNFLGLAGVVFTTKEKEIGALVSKLRESIKKVDNNDFVKQLRCPKNGFLKFYESVKEIENSFTSSGSVEFCGFTSWCNTGIYDIDFGWGKPIWATNHVPKLDDLDVKNINFIKLMDTRAEKGIEAWVSLDQAIFNFFEKDEELLLYASIDPSPIAYN